MIRTAVAIAAALLVLFIAVPLAALYLHVAPEAAYPIARVKAAPNADGARAFVDFIMSSAGKAFLKARGFEK